MNHFEFVTTKMPYNFKTLVKRQISTIPIVVSAWYLLKSDHINMKFFLTLISSLLFLTSSYGQGINLRCSGSASFQITSGGMNLEAGAPLANMIPNQTSAANAGDLWTVATGSLNYIVYVNRQEITWDSNIQIWTRRTGGSATNLTGGTVYQLANLTPDFFCSYTGVIPPNSSLPLQYELRFVGAVSAGSFTCNIVYTVVQQ